VGRLLKWPLAAFSTGAAVLHFAEIEPHIAEWWLFGAFFTIAWFQVAWAVLIPTTAARGVLVTGLVVNAAVMLIWIWSRTTGLPVGPEAGEPEAVGAADLAATVFEWLIVLGVAVGLPRLGASREPSRRVVVSVGTLVWVAVVTTTALVFLLEGEKPAVAH
jgi:hypothetical protein